ncbi:MAG TPA: hypothetical protein VFJ14_01800 [Nocardioidaceae bacterium]|nr:hypothetical protein [Nocardioidaceae bacterium]
MTATDPAGVAQLVTAEHYDDLLAERAALDAVRALHTPSVWTVGLHDGIFERAELCDECRTVWPCATARAVGAVA